MPIFWDQGVTNNKILNQVQDDKTYLIMKINWGTGIVIAFIGFIAFIMYFVINMNVNDKYNHDLVTEDYYEE